ncbi:class I SAM-dependent methyltransferase [Desulfogranum japonicum]|uniref:class I SAM-dependent methyltransferase n=1 Tax=Desulfogranum japonicum TaxID=231447 RepID=UPI00041C0821|nr:class I SAM-dependent methyltransferase [Desulfogranum japonicum]
MIIFDEYSNLYDAWFQRNQVVLESELRLVAHVLGKSPGRTLSVGCGTGLFEQLLQSQYDISITEGLEPSGPMGEIARKRGMHVTQAGAENMPLESGQYDTVMFNGSPGYIADLDAAVREAYRVLKPVGRVLLIDVPAESSYGILYRLGGAYGTWEDERLRGVLPHEPYPVELAGGANWRPTQDKIDSALKAGFTDLTFAQTLTRHPCFSDIDPEDPISGYQSGDYVAVCAVKS